MTMQLPCKHVMKVLEMQNANLYAPMLCSKRWTKQYFNQSHPVLSAHDKIPQPPVYVHTVKVPSEIDKYKQISKVSKEICNLGAGMSTGEFQYYMEKMNHLKNAMCEGNRADAFVRQIMQTLDVQQICHARHRLFTLHRSIHQHKSMLQR